MFSLAVAALVACLANALTAGSLGAQAVAPRQGLPFRYQPLTEPRLDRLASREELRWAISGNGGQFDQLKELRDWVASQWPAGTPDPYPPWNALTILDWIRDEKTGGFCAQYAQVFLQAAAALGHTARYVEIGSRDNPYAHYVTEVWSNEHNKWVMMDADYNVHFERRGVPLAALEIHDAFVSGEVARLTAVTGQRRAGHSDVRRWPHRTAELYYYVRFHLKADHLSRPDEPPFDRFNDMVEWADAQTVPWEEGEGESPYPRERLTTQRISDRDVVLAPINQVWVTVEATAEAVELRLDHNVSGFLEFEYRSVGGLFPAAWERTRSSILRLPPTVRGQSVEIRGVNIRGVRGPTTAIRIDAGRARETSAGGVS